MNFLFLRGLARHQGHWYGFEKRFKTETNQILLIDLPGNGEFAHLNSPTSIEESMNFARAQWISRKMGDNGPWFLISISMGGMVALSWLSQYKDDFEKIFVINSSTSDVVMPWERFNLNTFLKLPQLLLSKPENVERKILELTLSKRLVNLALVNDALKFKFMVTSKKNFLRQLYASSKFTLPNNLESSRLLFICGDKDHLVNPKASKNMAIKTQSKIVVNDEAGHDLPLDDSEWLFSVISSSLSSSFNILK